MRLSRRAAAPAAVALLLTSASPLSAQGWAVDVYAGGTRYPALAGHVSATNLIANVRFESVAGALGYVSVAAPLDEAAALWGAAGAGHTLLWEPARRFGLGAALGADGYAFDASAGGAAGGVVLHALPLIRVTSGPATLELRGGGHAHLFDFPDTTGTRGVLEAAARATLNLAPFTARGEARWLSAEEASYPYVGAQLTTSSARGRLWAWGGKWLADELDDVEWGVGGSVAVGSAAELWLTVRQEGADPLYEGSERRAWNVGFSRRLGGPRRAPPALVPRIARGSVRIRLPKELARDDGGAPSVAGEFSQWGPVAMTSAGAEWVLELPLEAGVYRFSFVSSSGEWFVPERYPGRIDDGFGGFIAVLVVP